MLYIKREMWIIKAGMLIYQCDSSFLVLDAQPGVNRTLGQKLACHENKCDISHGSKLKITLPA